MKKYSIQTERLGLRNWTEEDIEPMIEISASPIVMRHFPSTASPEQTRAFVRRMKAQFNEHSYCYFAVELLESLEFIGFIGLAYQTYEAPFTPCTDIGWRLHPGYWNKGYATEGAKACLEYGFNQMKLNEIYSVCTHTNTPSEHVMQKIGMEKQYSFIHPALKGNKELENCYLYKMINPNEKNI